MERLGKNHGGYFGERIVIQEVLRATARSAGLHGWESSALPCDGVGELLVLKRERPGARRTVYVSTGTHGDEPAGPLAALRLLEENHWPADANLFLCPCLNPSGFALNRRENAAGKDLNRDYKHFETPEVRSHVAWLKTLPQLDVAFCLHEDWEANGFYLYELNPDGLPSRAQAMVDAVSRACPIDLAPEIEGRPARGGIIHPSHDPMSRPQWPEAFWLLQNRTRLSYTLEAPSDFPLETRVGALVAAVRVGME